MRDDDLGRRLGPGVIRRRVRQTTVIPLPAPTERPEVPHPRRHAKTFVLALAAVMLAGTILLATPWTTESGEATPFVDALFIAVSATAVTGLVTVDTATHWNFFGELVILILIQAGGLGFMVGASIVLQVLRRGSTRLRDVLLVQEGAPTLSLREAVELSRRIAIFTFATEAAGAVALTIRFWRDMDPWDAIWQGVFHAVSAFCNAGFDIRGNFASLSDFRTSVVVNVVIILLIQAGSLSYLALEDVVRCRRWAPLALDTKLVLLGNGVLVVGGAVAFLMAEWTGVLSTTHPGVRPMVALFQSAATRTAGFSTVDFGDVRGVTLFLLIGLMLIGGAPGSTAGGVKLTTISVVVVAVLSTLKGQEEPQIFGRRVPTPLIFRAMAVIVIMMTVHFVATVLLTVTDDLLGGTRPGFLALMFESMSALATVGLSTGITPELTTGGKLILCLVMFFGRIGPLTAVFALQRRQRPTRYRYPVATVRIG